MAGPRVELSALDKESSEWLTKNKLLVDEANPRLELLWRELAAEAATLRHPWECNSMYVNPCRCVAHLVDHFRLMIQSAIAPSAETSLLTDQSDPA